MFASILLIFSSYYLLSILFSEINLVVFFFCLNETSMNREKSGPATSSHFLFFLEYGNFYLSYLIFHQVIFMNFQVIFLEKQLKLVNIKKKIVKIEIISGMAFLNPIKYSDKIGKIFLKFSAKRINIKRQQKRPCLRAYWKKK